MITGNVLKKGAEIWIKILKYLIIVVKMSVINLINIQQLMKLLINLQKEQRIIKEIYNIILINEFII